MGDDLSHQRSLQGGTEAVSKPRAPGSQSPPPAQIAPTPDEATRTMQDNMGNARVRRMFGASAPGIQRMPGQRQGTEPGAQPHHATSTIRSSNGLPLERAVRGPMEAAFDTDFGDVRVHTDAQAGQAARAIDAKAFTTGQDIYFAIGQYQPSTRDGDKLLAHELVHTMQQRNAANVLPVASTISQPGDPLEREADEAASGKTTITGRAHTPLISRQPDSGASDLEHFPYQDQEFIEHFAEQIKRDLRAEMQGVRLPTGSRYISWADGSEERFIRAILSILLANTGKQFETDLYRYLTPAAVIEAVHIGREIIEIQSDWLGGRDYFPAAAFEIRSVLARRLAASLPRIAPRYLVARNQAALGERASAMRSRTPPPEPREVDIIASAPIDQLVIPALLAGTVTVDLAAYRAANPQERRKHQIQPVRTIAEGDWRFEAVRGLWSWIRVLRPADATVEEVARLLYGNETRSDLIVPGPPFFGFDPDRLSGLMLKRWRMLAGEDEIDTQYRILHGVPRPKPGQRETTLQHGYSPERSAAVELLYSTQADEIALIQARGAKPTGATRADIVTRLTLCLKLLDHSDKDAKRFSLDFEPARTRLQERLEAVKALASPRLAYRWDAQSAGQLDILQRAVTGLRLAADHHAAMDAQAPTEEPLGAPSPYQLITAPVIQVGRAYVEAARISELLVTADQKLGEADERAKRLPFDFAEARLRIMRQTLAQMAINRSEPGQRYTPAQLEAAGYAELSREEVRLRRQVAAAREKMVIDPVGALGELGKLQPRLGQAELGVQLGGVLDQLMELFNAVSGQKQDSGGLGSIFTSHAYEAEKQRVYDWARRWSDLYGRYRAGQAGTAQFKQDLKDLSNDPEWKKLFSSVLSRLSDLREREAWINFVGKIAALVAIAIATAGVGALAEGAGFGAWAVAGFEAVTFTTLSLPLEDKVSIEGFFLHVAENWVTFGLVKGASALYEATVSEEFARTLLGKGVGGLVNFATATAVMIAQAEIESKASRNRSLSTSEVKGILGESTAVTLATILAARYARPFLAELRTRGQAFRGEIDAVNAMRTENLALAEAVKQTKSSTLAKTLAAADAQQAELEGDVLRKLAHDGVEAKDDAARKLSPEQQQLVAELTQGKEGRPSPVAQALAEQISVARARTLVEMEPIGPDEFLADPGKDILSYAERFFKAGAEVLGPEPNQDGSRSIMVDFHDGHPFEVIERAPGAGPITRPAEAPPLPALEGRRPAVKESAAAAEPDIEAAPEPAAGEVRDAEQAKYASTKIPPEERRALIKDQGEKLKAGADRERAVKMKEGAELKKRTDSIRRKIVDYTRQKEGASTKQKERLNEKIRKLATQLHQLDTRASKIGSEIARLSETMDVADRMIKGNDIDTLPCFPPGTPVWTARGAMPIETLSAGTAVVCWDEQRGEQDSGRITKVHSNRTSWLFHITTSAGPVDATGGHRFFAEETGWTAAREIRAGMRLRAHEGSLVVQSVTLESQETATYNLSIDPFPTFYVGPGLLVHNAANFHLGNYLIYEGYNEEYPDLIYIGQTNDLKRREAEHRAEGRDGLERKFLTDRERLFYKFKAGMKLRPRLTGLDKDTAKYFEHTNKEWEESWRGPDKVMNRIEIVAEENWEEVKQRVTDRYCPR